MIVTTTTKRARSLRQSENDAEERLWIELRNRRLHGIKFVRQLPIGPYFADFACRETKPESKQPEIIQHEPNYNIHNYKLDDDEIARRKIQDSIDAMNDSLASKK